MQRVLTSRRLRPVIGVLGTVYLLAVVYVTLRPRLGTSGALTPNFVPLASVYDLLFDSAATPALVTRNLVGNVLLLAPLAGLLYAGLRWTELRTLGGVAVVSGLTEATQGFGLTDGRQANVDDVLLNLLGAAAVILLLRLLGRSTASWAELGRSRQHA